MTAARTWDFAAELARYPAADHPGGVTAEEARAYCRWMAGVHYENFPVLSIAVPKPLRQDFANVYAYCRWSDDLGDETGGGGRALELLDAWEQELRRAYEGKARHPITIALAETIARFEIPPTPFIDLLDAFRRDQTQKTYATYAELLDYCRCSANPVGQLVLYLAGRHRPENAADSDAICTGLQLANFWQDVARDAAIGRIYLPAEDRERFGVPEADVLAGRDSPELRELVRFECERAEGLLRSGLPLARRMPGRLRLAIALFANGGLGILRAIKRAGYGSMARRPKLGKSSYLGIGARAVFASIFPVGGKRQAGAGGSQESSPLAFRG